MEPNPVTNPPKPNERRWAAAVDLAPENIQDPECPYDPNDEKAVTAFWAKAKVTRPAGPKAD